MRYPIYRESRERITLRSGRPIDDLSVANLNEGRLGAADLGIHEETLREQARIAEESGFVPLSRNLALAAELTRLPDAKILEIYEALRRGDGADLEALAREAEDTWSATKTAAFIREAARRPTSPPGSR